LTEAIDTTTPAGRMMMQMVGAFAEFERAILVELPNWLHLSVFLLNIAILLYILHIRIAAYRDLAREEAEAQGRKEPF
jgi:uncharacterized membrane protein YhdT